MILIQSVNFYTLKDSNNCTPILSGFSIVILQRRLLIRRNTSLTFLLQKNGTREFAEFDKESSVLEIYLNSTFHFWDQREQSIPLRVTKELQQITQLLFSYYLHGKFTYSVDKVIYSLVDQIIKLNSASLIANHYFVLLLKFMEENITSPLRISDFCKVIHLSESSLNRLCHKHAGTTAMRLFRKMQCWEAERLLADTSLTIQEISERMGFKSSKSFSTMYRRNEGISLLDKRRELQSDKRGKRKRRIYIPTNSIRFKRVSKINENL